MPPEGVTSVPVEESLIVTLIVVVEMYSTAYVKKLEYDVWFWKLRFTISCRVSSVEAISKTPVLIKAAVNGVL
jgi:hypothetical protein